MTDHEPNQTHATSDPGAQGPGPAPSQLDKWMAEHPWHPRIAPEFLYLLLLMVVKWARDFDGLMLAAIYVAQCVMVTALLWRYRKLTPELNWRFHWLCLPVGVGVCAVWVLLGDAMTQLFPEAFDPKQDGMHWDPLGRWDENAQLSPTEQAVAWANLSLRLLGMSLVVPMFEELFNRSLLLRSFNNLRKTTIGFVQFLYDLPVIGDLIANKQITKKAMKHDRVFGNEFERVGLGGATAFGIAASTLVFMLAHHPRDYPGCIVCGVAYCLLVKWTNRPGAEHGLGPVIWAHAITNALLWVYVVAYDAWHYL